MMNVTKNKKENLEYWYYLTLIPNIQDSRSYIYYYLSKNKSKSLLYHLNSLNFPTCLPFGRNPS